MFKYQTVMSTTIQRGIHPFKARIKFVVLAIVADVTFYVYLETIMVHLHCTLR